MEKLYFFDVLEDLLWSDNRAAISSHLVHTEPIKERFILDRKMHIWPSCFVMHDWFTEAGYTKIGRCFVPCAGSGRGTFWTKYPELFIVNGVVDTKAVAQCVYRRKLYVMGKSKVDVNEVLSAGDMSKIFDTSLNTIRAWDKSGLVPAMRTDGGHRRYRIADLLNYP